jgi:hypothetical protein
MNKMSKRAFKGYWWLPDGEEAGGVATYHPENGIELELFSPISESDHRDFDGEANRVSRILGLTTENELLTLDDCVQTQSSREFTSKQSLDTETYRANNLFVGDHITEDEISFDRFRVSYPLLYQWTGTQGLNFAVSDNADFDISYDVPSAKKVALERFDLKLLFSVSTTTSRSGKLTLEENAYLEFDPDSGSLTFDEIQRQVSKWQDFITLATGENVPASEVVGYTNSDSSEMDQSVEIFYTTSSRPDPPETVHPSRTNFMLTDIEENFTTVLRNWAEQSNQYESAYDLYFSVVYESQMYLQNQYVTLMSALEGFHREKFRDDTETISHIRESLEEITTQYADVFAALPWDISDMASELVDIRNKAIHGNIVKQTDQLDLYDYVLLLQGMLEAILLDELKIPVSHIKDRLRTRYNSLRPENNG